MSRSTEPLCGFGWAVRIKFALPCLLALFGCVVPKPRPATFPGAPNKEASAYLEAWTRGDFERQRSLLANDVKSFEATHEEWQKKLAVVESHFELGSAEAQADGSAVVNFEALHTLRGLGTWRYRSQMRFVRKGPGQAWALAWSPATIHPELRPGDRIVRTRQWMRRADIRDADGQPLTVTEEDDGTVTVGADPRKTSDRQALLESLRAHTGLDPERAAEALATADARATFVPLIDLPRERYQQARPALAAVRGIFFRKRGGRRLVSENLATHTLGRVGEATAELLATLGPKYQTGDVVGLSGLERALEPALAGEPEGRVVFVGGSGEKRTVHTFEGVAPLPVRTTLRTRVQQAAEAALQEVTAPAAIVALDVRTGDVKALVSRPLDSSLHRALVGLYPPGSTFKIVTAEALLRAGLTPQSPVVCPAEAKAGHTRFRNFQGEAFGATTFRKAFAHSCNTAFVLQAMNLGAEALEAAAARYGFGVAYDVGLPSPRAAFPRPVDQAELAAAAIGQGRVLATPLHMASVAAAATAGVWRAPRLIGDKSERPEVELRKEHAEHLRSLMKSVVEEGTGRSAASVKGLIGKTGTAEFGTGKPPPTHAWFVGIYDETALAVLVEGGGVGGQVALPIAMNFVRRLAGE